MNIFLIWKCSQSINFVSINYWTFWKMFSFIWLGFYILSCFAHFFFFCLLILTYIRTDSWLVLFLNIIHPCFLVCVWLCVYLWPQNLKYDRNTNPNAEHEITEQQQFFFSMYSIWSEYYVFGLWKSNSKRKTCNKIPFTLDCKSGQIVERIYKVILKLKRGEKKKIK